MLTAQDVPDAIFRTDNPLGIPVLDLALQLLIEPVWN